MPDVLLWSPRQFANSIDHLISPGFRWMAFEAKGITDDRRIKIGAIQLQTHAASRMKILYVLPAFEQTMGITGSNTCNVCCQLNAACSHCVRDPRSRAIVRIPSPPRHLPAVAAPATPDQQIVVNAQYHFGHWLWIISANDLLASRPGLQISAEDAGLGAIRGAKRLCHAIGGTSPGGVQRPISGSISWNEVSTEDPEGQELKSEAFQNEIRTALVATFEMGVDASR